MVGDWGHTGVLNRHRIQWFEAVDYSEALAVFLEHAEPAGTVA